MCDAFKMGHILSTQAAHMIIDCDRVKHVYHSGLGLVQLKSLFVNRHNMASD